MHGRDPQSDRPGIAEATLSRRSTVHRRHRGATRVRGPNDSSKTATHEDQGPTERPHPETARREHRYRLEPGDGLCRWSDGDRRKLSGRKGHLSLISKDVDQIETFRRCLRLEVPVSQIRTATGIHHKVQWCDRGLYDWFVGAGLTPAKSRTLGPLAVPDSVFPDFFRGCIDGDGSVLVYIDRYHAARRPQYVYERLYVSLVSASLRFLDWIKASVGRMVCVGGAIHRSGPRDRPLVDAALRQGRIDTAHRLDVLFAGRSRPWSQARQGREISNAAGLCLCAFSRTTESRVVVHWPGLRHVEGSGPGWCNGSHAGLKIQCP